MDNFSLPPWITAEAILGLGVLAAAIVDVFLAYRELKPGLRVRVNKCTHKIRYAGPGRRSGDIAGTEIVPSFEINNTGGRTTIYQIEIKCKPGKQEYRTTERIQHPIVVDHGGHEPLTHQFYIPKREVSENSLDCTFFLHHTFARKKVKARSSLVGR